MAELRIDDNRFQHEIVLRIETSPGYWMSIRVPYTASGPEAYAKVFEDAMVALRGIGLSYFHEMLRAYDRG